MSYDLLGYDMFNAGGYNPYGMNLTNSLYMMNFYDQLKNYYAGSASRAADGTGKAAAGSSGTTAASTADFQTAFQEAFRKALQETMGITDSAAAASQTASGAGKTTVRVSDSTASAQSAYQAMSSYRSHPSRIWTSSLSHS